jgi:hypothetical protein
MQPTLIRLIVWEIDIYKLDTPYWMPQSPWRMKDILSFSC